MSWTDERVDLLKKLWSEGLSASQIAGRLGGVTRNAVIGKVHRLGLSGRATTSRIKSMRPRSRVPAAPKRQIKSRFSTNGNPAVRALYEPSAEPFQPAIDELVIPLEERKCIQSLTENSCRWPIGDPQHEEFHFCGKNKVAGLPYCEHHARRAFQPPQSRRRAPAVEQPTPALEDASAKEPAKESV
ncbi:MAG: GcrA family cell cycle regulator [Pseudomonadota bacterium]